MDQHPVSVLSIVGIVVAVGLLAILFPQQPSIVGRISEGPIGISEGPIGIPEGPIGAHEVEKITPFKGRAQPLVITQTTNFLDKNSRAVSNVELRNLYGLVVHNSKVYDLRDYAFVHALSKEHVEKEHKLRVSE